MITVQENLQQVILLLELLGEILHLVVIPMRKGAIQQHLVVILMQKGAVQQHLVMLPMLKDSKQ